MKPITKVPASLLYVSEPNPRSFGNEENLIDSPHWTNKNWLKSRFHFTFAEYSSDSAAKFGVLRVLNDDLVQPSRGFGTHPHRNMEIVTYIINGHLTHKDSMGTEESLHRGAIQFMTAGSGVFHSEHNLHPTETLRFLQLWIVPRSENLPPNYGSMVATEQTQLSRKNKWAHFVADVQNTAQVPIKINQDVNIYVTELDKGVAVNFKVQANRQAYFVCMEGTLSLNGQELTQHDAAEIKGEISLDVKAESENSHAMIVEMAKTSDTRF